MARSRKSLRYGLLALCILLATHNLIHAKKFRWDPSSATPGLYLELIPTSPDSSVNPPVPRYYFKVNGFPGNTEFALWSYNLLDGAREWAKGVRFVMDADGLMVTKEKKKPFPKGVPLEKIRMGAWDHIPGEMIEFAVASTDGELAAYARVAPYPIEDKNHSRRIWVERTPDIWKVFLISGTGFMPNEQLIIHSKSNEELLLDTLTAEVDGSFSMLFGPATVGAENGHCEFSLQCATDTLTVGFDWGKKR